MKTLWILYMIACPNCEWQEISKHETVNECRLHQRRGERMRSAIGYWHDYTRFECVRK